MAENFFKASISIAICNNRFLSVIKYYFVPLGRGGRGGEGWGSIDLNNAVILLKSALGNMLKHWWR